jgi:hypothetical protein
LASFDSVEDFGGELRRKFGGSTGSHGTEEIA